MMRMACLVGLTAIAGCNRATHDMIDQPRLNPATTSPVFADGNATREPPSGSMAHSIGDAAAVSGGRRGVVATDATPAGSDLAKPPMNAALMQRGRERYAIYCLPCHGATGAGDGEVGKRGFPAPPSLVDATLRNAEDAHLHDVIEHGWGVMYPFADRVSPADAWAIVGYLRALQQATSVTSR